MIPFYLSISSSHFVACWHSHTHSTCLHSLNTVAVFCIYGWEGGRQVQLVLRICKLPAAPSLTSETTCHGQNLALLYVIICLKIKQKPWDSWDTPSCVLISSLSGRLHTSTENCCATNFCFASLNNVNSFSFHYESTGVFTAIKLLSK